MRRSYAGGAVSTTIVSPITTSSPNAVLTSANGWPDTSEGPFAAVLSRGTPTEEKVLIVDRSGTAITFSARGYDGTQAQNHSASATIEHIATAVDHDEANAHVNASTGVHGVVGTVVGTSGAQTLTDKTVSGPLADFVSLRRAGFEVATRTGTETLTNKTLTSPVLTGTAQAGQVNADSVNVGGVPVVTTTASQVVENKTIKNSAIENSSLVGATVDGVVTAGAGSTFEGSEIVNLDKAQTLTNKTLDAPVLTNTTIGGWPLAVRRFSPVYQQETSPSAVVVTSSLATTELSRLFVTPGANNQVEVMFSWFMLERVSGSSNVTDRLQVTLEWTYTTSGTPVVFGTHGVEVNGHQRLSGGMVRGLFRPDADGQCMVTAWLTNAFVASPSGGWRVYAGATAPMTLSARPTAL